MPELTPSEIADLRSEAHDLQPILQVGKSGVTDATIAEIERQLKARKLIKLKLLKAAREQTGRKDLAAELAERTGAVLVEVRGNTVVLWKGRRKRRPAVRVLDDDDGPA